jgi:hypothetical protein
MSRPPISLRDESAGCIVKKDGIQNERENQETGGH